MHSLLILFFIFLWNNAVFTSKNHDAFLNFLPLPSGSSNAKVANPLLARLLQHPYSDEFGTKRENDELMESKQKVERTLKTNHLPYACAENGVIIVMVKATSFREIVLHVAPLFAAMHFFFQDKLHIYPPYGPKQCQSPNEIILSRVQQLLQN